MKKTVFFVSTLNTGGIETYLLRFIRNKYQDFSKIYIYVKNGETGTLYNEFNSIGNVEIITKKLIITQPKSILQTFKFLKKTRPNSICDFSGALAGITMLAGRLAGVKNRITFYRDASIAHRQYFIKNIVYKLLKNLVVTHSNYILFNSKAGKEFHHPNTSEKDIKYKIIYNGIDFKSFNSSSSNLKQLLEIPDKAFVIGHLGRLDPSKNHQTIFEVAKILYNIDPSIYFIMCGLNVQKTYGPLIENEGMSDRIKTLEHHSPAIEFFNTINCFYFPSWTEGHPNALLEAMVCGIPVVASDIAAIRECMPQGYQYYLVPPGNYITAAEKLLHIYNEGGYTNPEAIIKLYDGKYWFNKFYELL